MWRNVVVRRSGVAALLMCLIGTQISGACDQNCNMISQSCTTDGAGNCQTGACYQYYATGSTYTLSCWTCGSGAPGGGWCLLGDPGVKCLNTYQNINFKFYQTCQRTCNNANSHVEAKAFEDVTTKTGTEPRYICNPK